MTRLYAVLDVNLPADRNRSRVVEGGCGLRKEDGMCVYGEMCLYPNNEKDRVNCHLARQANALRVYADSLAQKR